MPTISVVIPAWDEAPLIADAVRCAAAIGDEVIVVDGGSRDGTADIAGAAGARVIRSAKGRGVQLRAGARAARGDVLLFLHADARLAPSARRAVGDAMADPGLVGGSFYIRFLPRSWFTRLLEPFNELRRRVTSRHYGDAAPFVRRDAYWRLGGHRSWPVMHDYEFAGRMARAGRCVHVVEPCVWASARRFAGREIRVFITWVSVQLLYWLFVPPRWLGLLYPDVRGGAPQRFVALARQRTA